MKNKIIITAIVCSLGILASCSGDRTPQNVNDTAHNTYGAKDNSKIDTSKATGGDNSGSGGTKIVKDTAKKDTSKAPVKK
ncbi:MAG: hypothetical protein JWP44_2146 [Mucilaginibacter sp.]|nr:hypothetical protein [Mucilaginibacter sp.]